MTKNTIRVCGLGVMTQAPDCITLILFVTEKHHNFQKAVELCHRRGADLPSAAAQNAMPVDSLKTTRLDVREDEQHVSGAHRHVGFVGTHQVTPGLDNDHECEAWGHF